MIGFVCDEISTDPWTAIGFDGVREKAWERGLRSAIMATRGDAEMERAELAQFAPQGLSGLIYATINTRLIRAPRRCRRPDRAAELSCRRRSVAVDRARRSRGRTCGDRLSWCEPAIGASDTSTASRAWKPRGTDCKGYRQALATADLPFDPDLVRDGNWEPISGYDARMS